MDRFSDFSDDDVVADDTASARDTSRDSLFLIAELRIAGAEKGQQVRVRNLSSGGLMAEYAGKIDQGAVVELDVRGIGRVRGVIAWVAGGRIGVSFDRKIDPMAARKPSGGAAKPANVTGPVTLR